MKIIVPYNEILPTRRAHDLYLFNFCRSLAKKGIDVELLSGKGPLSKKFLFDHYGEKDLSLFTTVYLPILRKSKCFGISWNLIFFSAVQRYLKKLKPQLVHLSTLKQAYYHLQRKVPGVRYIFEAHQLSFYEEESQDAKKLEKEHYIFENVDLLVVTTHQLEKVLRKAPYCVKGEIEVVPLSVDTIPLPPPEPGPLLLGYIGQLYQGQGLEMLLQALQNAPFWKLRIIGGRDPEIKRLQKMCEELMLDDRVEFMGYCDPKSIKNVATGCHAFVAPFESKGRMPYVAHTKLLEYAVLGRPVIAPDLPITQEHFAGGKGVFLFKPDCSDSLAKALFKLSDPKIRERIQEEITEYSTTFSSDKRAEHYLHLLSDGKNEFI